MRSGRLGSRAGTFWPHSLLIVSDLLLGAFEDTSFASLSNLVNENTLKAIEEMGFKRMTEIQHKSIRPLLEGRYG